MKKVIYIIMCLCASVSCTETVEYPAEFAVADSLAEYDEAQKALVLLDSVGDNDALRPEPVRMRYELLKYKAADKAYLPITSDSTILQILSYYKRTQEEWLPEAYYYAGRTYSELGDAPRALDCFQQAATLMEGSPRWVRTLSRAYAQMASIFSMRWMTDESIKYYKLSAALSEQLGDSSSLVSTYSNIAGEYHHENWDSVIYYIDKATAIADACHDTVWYYQLLKEKAGTYILLGKFNEARESLNMCFEHQIWPGRSGIWSVAANLYDSLARKDSLEICLRQAYLHGNVYAKRNASYRMSRLYAEKNEINNALRFLTECLSLSDSIEISNNAQILQEMESSYNYNIYVRENEMLRLKEQEERTQKQRAQLALLFGLLVGIVVFFYMYKRNRWQRDITAVQINRINSLSFEKIKALTKVLQEKELLYLDVSQRNEFLQQEIELTRTEIESARQQLKIHASQLEVERAKVSHTDLFQTLRNANHITDDQIRLIEEYYHENNPQFLASLRSLCRNSSDEWPVSLLIRMDIPQAQIAVLMSKTQSAIHNIRQRAATRLKGEESKADDWNHIVEAL